MSSKLDQSLDEITGGRRGGPRRANRRVGKPAVQVVGGVSKNKAAPRAGKAATAAPAAAPVQTRGESKIIVSNLPDDVNEQQIKEYFSSTVGPVKKALLNYTKNGKSTGVANIIFSKPTSAAEAAKSYDGVKVDGRPMRIEVVMGAKLVPPPPPAKTLSDRIQGAPKAAKANPKKAGAATAKPATAKPANAGATTAGGRGRGGRRRGPGRTKKTAEELDADMVDYFDPNAATTNGAAPATVTNGAATTPAATNGGEAAMEDEIM